MALHKIVAGNMVVITGDKGKEMINKAMKEYIEVLLEQKKKSTKRKKSG